MLDLVRDRRVLRVRAGERLEEVAAVESAHRVRGLSRRPRRDLSPDVGFGPRGRHFQQEIPVAGEGRAGVLRVRLMRRELEEDAAPPLPGVQVALALRPPPGAMEGVEERAQRHAHAPPLDEAVLAAEGDPLRVSEDEGGVRGGAVLVCKSLRAEIKINTSSTYSSPVLLTSRMDGTIFPPPLRRSKADEASYFDPPQPVLEIFTS